jgi:hypothetical protein
MLELITIPVIRKLFKKIKDQHPKGYLTKTPAAALNLQPGELVEIKSLEEIVETLDLKGKNRGLSFEPDMIAYCGKRFKVKSRLDRMILEKNGQMVEVKNSVLLENATCNCYYAFAGCPRREYQYWREIWLRRIAIMIIFISHLSIELMNLKPELKLFSIANYQQTLMFFGIAA